MSCERVRCFLSFSRLDQLPLLLVLAVGFQTFFIVRGYSFCDGNSLGLNGVRQGREGDGGSVKRFRESTRYERYRARVAGTSKEGVAQAGVLWLVLCRGPVGEIERDASYQSDEQACNKSSGKTQRSDVAMVQEGQQNGGDQSQGEA